MYVRKLWKGEIQNSYTAILEAKAINFQIE